MMKFRNLLFPALLTLAACGGPDSDASPMAGNWTDAAGMKLTFDGYSNKLLAHGIPGADGVHDHNDGTYTYDDKTKVVTLKVKLVGLGKDDSWTGKVVEEKLQIESGKDKVTFQKGGKDDGH